MKAGSPTPSKDAHLRCSGDPHATLQKTDPGEGRACPEHTGLSGRGKERRRSHLGSPVICGHWWRVEALCPLQDRPTHGSQGSKADSLTEPPHLSSRRFWCLQTSKLEHVDTSHLLKQVAPSVFIFSPDDPRYATLREGSFWLRLTPSCQPSPFRFPINPKPIPNSILTSDGPLENMNSIN